MYQVICFGEIVWDMFPDGKKPGGAPMNVALHLKKQGIVSKIISSVGNDDQGKELKSFLQLQKLADDHIQTHPYLPTGTVSVQLDEHRQAIYTINQPVAWDEIHLTTASQELIKNSDALVFGSLACRTETSRNSLLQLLEHSRISILDLNLRPPHFQPELLKELIAKCTILKVNEEELEHLCMLFSISETNSIDQLRAFADHTNTKTICVTLGSKGAIILHDKKTYQHPGFKVEVADTVGAGDAFLASFIAGFLQEVPVSEIIKRSCATGALVASRKGANPDYTIKELEQLGNF